MNLADILFMALAITPVAIVSGMMFYYLREHFALMKSVQYSKRVFEIVSGNQISMTQRYVYLTSTTKHQADDDPAFASCIQTIKSMKI